MMMREPRSFAPSITRRGFLTLAAAAPLCAGETWDRKPFPDWDAGFRDHLLSDSPWAKQVSIPYEHLVPPRAPRTDTKVQSDFLQIELPDGFGLPRTRTRNEPARIPQSAPGISLPVKTELNLVVRWSSALPIKQALAYERWGPTGLRSEEARAFLDREETDYVVEICGFPAIFFSQDPQKLQRQLAKSARLWFKERPSIRPRTVLITEPGNHMSAEILFPRSAPIKETDGMIEIAAEIGQSRLSAKFKPATMLYQGKIEL